MQSLSCFHMTSNRKNPSHHWVYPHRERLKTSKIYGSTYTRHTKISVICSLAQPQESNHTGKSNNASKPPKKDRITPSQSGFRMSFANFTNTRHDCFVFQLTGHGGKFTINCSL